MNKETSDSHGLPDQGEAMETAVLYCECCFKMGRRFKRLGRKFKASGQFEMANKMEAEAVIQLDAWRKAQKEIWLQDFSSVRKAG